MYAIIETLSNHAPNFVCVPCIAIDPGPKNVDAAAYNKAILKDPNIGDLLFVASSDNL